MDADILCRLSTAEADLIYAVENGGLNLTSFEKRWSDIRDLIKKHPSRLHPSTLKAAQDAAVRIEALASNLADLLASHNQHTNNLSSETDKIVDNLNLKTEVVHPGHDTSRSDSIPPNQTTSDSNCDPYSVFIPNALRWLIHHLHDPYPTDEVKARLSDESGISKKTTNTWFTNIRRRIGWTRIVKRYFRGVRSEMTEYARRVLIDGQSGSKSSSEVETERTATRELLEMKEMVENLYQHRYEESEFVKGIEFQPKQPPSVNADGGREGGQKRKRSSSSEGRDSSLFVVPINEDSPRKPPSKRARVISGASDASTCSLTSESSIGTSSTSPSTPRSVSFPPGDFNDDSASSTPLPSIDLVDHSDLQASSPYSPGKWLIPNIQDLGGPSCKPILKRAHGDINETSSSRSPSLFAEVPPMGLNIAAETVGLCDYGPQSLFLSDINISDQGDTAIDDILSLSDWLHNETSDTLFPNVSVQAGLGELETKNSLASGTESRCNILTLSGTSQLNLDDYGVAYNALDIGQPYPLFLRELLSH